MLHAGKALTEPLLVLLVIAVIAVVFSMRHRAARRSSGIALAALLLMALLSLQVTGALLARSLLVRDAAGGKPPDVIVVAAGGLREGVPTLLSMSSESRVTAGVAWWRQHPRARLVMAGADTHPGYLTTTTLELMRASAIRAGVPPSAIVLETRSKNTREHPIGLLQLPGVTRETHVGVVTSDWHMRRTAAEFRRHFRRVSTRAAESGGPPQLVINDFLPSSQGLRTSTRLLHEWLGIAWYALRR